MVLVAGAMAFVIDSDGAPSLEPVSGIHFAISGGEKSVQVGQDVVFTLRFSNRSEQPVRVYLVRSEPFRAGQSSFLVRRVVDGAPVDLQPVPRPHGYVVGESDFHLIAPGETIADRQTLRLSPERFKAGEEHIVRWVYENRIKRWPGGVRTVDGLTKPLFGGTEIPFIWVGRSEVETRIRIEQ